MPSKATSITPARGLPIRGIHARDDKRVVATPSKEMQQVMITRVGLRIPAGLSYEGWEHAGQRLADVMDSSAWCLGDWIVHGENQYADRYRRAVEAVGLEYQTIRNYAWVARRFQISRRRSALSFQHHAEVARFSDEDQDIWLGRAETLKWSRNELRRNIRNARATGEPTAATVPLPRIQAEQTRLARWRSAAEQAHDSFERWIVASLDAAASAALGDSAPDPS